MERALFPEIPAVASQRAKARHELRRVLLELEYEAHRVAVLRDAEPSDDERALKIAGAEVRIAALRARAAQLRRAAGRLAKAA